LGNTGHNRHKHCKRRLFDCEQFSRYGHEHGVFIFVIGNSFQKSERVGKPGVAFPLAVLEAHTGRYTVSHVCIRVVE
jgi:hypothetical protein